MYRVTAMIKDGEITTKTIHFRYKETPVAYSILFDDGRLMDNVKKESVGVAFDYGKKGQFEIYPQIMWTFNPEEAEQILIIRVREEIQKRLDYVDSIKHLI